MTRLPDRDVTGLGTARPLFGGDGFDRVTQPLEGQLVLPEDGLRDALDGVLIDDGAAPFSSDPLFLAARMRHRAALPRGASWGMASCARVRVECAHVGLLHHMLGL